MKLFLVPACLLALALSASACADEDECPAAGSCDHHVGRDDAGVVFSDAYRQCEDQRLQCMIRLADRQRQTFSNDYRRGYEDGRMGNPPRTGLSPISPTLPRTGLPPFGVPSTGSPGGGRLPTTGTPRPRLPSTGTARPRGGGQF